MEAFLEAIDGKNVRSRKERRMIMVSVKKHGVKGGKQSYELGQEDGCFEVVYAFTTLSQARIKWEQDDYICIYNEMPNIILIDTYQN